MNLNEQASRIGNRWDFCASGYSEIIHREFHQEQVPKWGKILRENAPCETGKALDIGTGPGFFAILLGQMGWDVTGIDCSPAMVEIARKNVAEIGVHANFEVMDNHKLDYEDNTFDFLVARNVTWIMYDPEKAFREWNRVLKPGGRLLYFDANWHTPKDPELAANIDADRAEYIEKYGQPENAYTGDKKTDEQFNEVLYFQNINRPAWDRLYLPGCGYSKVTVDPRVNERVYSEAKQLLYRSIPMFMVAADK